MKKCSIWKSQLRIFSPMKNGISSLGKKVVGGDAECARFWELDGDGCEKVEG